MIVLFASFAAGALTALAPCTLPFLPIIVAGTAPKSTREHRRASYQRIALVIAGLTGSIFLFSLALKATTAFLFIPSFVWSIVSASIITLLGVMFVAPAVWEKILQRIPFGSKANVALQSFSTKTSKTSALLTGAALGPVFNSCSPTYALIIAILLPNSLSYGLTALALYCFGLALALVVISLVSHTLIRRIARSINPDGWLRKLLGIMLIIVGLSIAFGIDKQVQAGLLDSGIYRPIELLEQRITNFR